MTNWDDDTVLQLINKRTPKGVKMLLNQEAAPTFEQLLKLPWVDTQNLGLYGKLVFRGACSQALPTGTSVEDLKNWIEFVCLREKGLGIHGEVCRYSSVTSPPPTDSTSSDEDCIDCWVATKISSHIPDMIEMALQKLIDAAQNDPLREELLRNDDRVITNHRGGFLFRKREDLDDVRNKLATLDKKLDDKTAKLVDVSRVRLFCRS